jgi:NADH-quinone oxidoreductase subunit J
MSGGAAPGELLSGAAGWAFLLFAAVGIGTGLAVVLAKNPVHSALFLLASFLMVASIFILQKAEFVGAVQILVYAGGIMVLFLFVIMLVHQRTVRTATAFHHQWDISLLLIAGALVVFLYILGTEAFPSVTSNPDALKSVAGKVVGNTEAVSLYLYRDYLVPFEVASVFLLVAMIGAVVLGRRSTEKMD